MSGVYEVQPTQSALPKIKICAVKVPIWDDELDRTQQLDGVLVEDKDNPAVRDYFYPLPVIEDDIKKTINAILWQKNNALNESLKQAYLEKRDIMIVNKKGKLKLVPWVDYEDLFTSCSFYMKPEISKGKVIEI